MDRLVPLDESQPCRPWAGYINRYGYGQTTIGLTHRLIYKTFVGELPDDLVIDHLCFNPPCVNPAHLRVTTRSENSKRQRRAHRARTATHCANGHLWTLESTKTNTRSGGRICRVCGRDATRRYAARQRERVA